MGYATISTGYAGITQKSSDTRTFRAMWIAGWYAVVNQTIVTVEEEWYGLSKTDAESLCITSETSTLDGATRNYLGGMTAYSSSGANASWMRADACWGVRVVSVMAHTGSSPNLYSVHRTTQTITASAPNAARSELY